MALRISLVAKVVMTVGSLVEKNVIFEEIARE